VKIIGNTHVPGLVTWISNKLSSSASRLYLPRFGVSLTDWRVLAYFEVHRWSTASQACESLDFDKAAVSRSVRVLQKSGYLLARPQGLRKIEYAPTPSGSRLYERMLQVALEREEALLSGLTSSERETLIRLLQHVLLNVDAVARVGQEQDNKAKRGQKQGGRTTPSRANNSRRARNTHPTNT